MWMVLPWGIFDNHTVGVPLSQIKPSTERRPHHYRNRMHLVNRHRYGKEALADERGEYA